MLIIPCLSFGHQIIRLTVKINVNLAELPVAAPGHGKKQKSI